ncbi:reverse transcriptase/maturase family protein [uncultured Ruminococcus sp.]|uniref:reverse transcriptase/maturase family protein n=1 Tax=uncultured Ruminococcus sp. TaxID=165186 RepID=UPI002637069D|nr:reverse transcriptase/maturase family protein [uncultured Ruminococcus sp.]
MSILDKLSQRKVWESFYKYKCSLVGSSQFCKELRSFIDSEKYIPVCDMIASGKAFPLPQKSVISKMDTQKKRIVYTYPYAENTVLKLLAYLLLRKYDSVFSDGLYSFRPNKTAKDAVRRLIRTPRINEMYSYKADISNYFNSVPLEKLLPILHKTVSDDERLYTFLAGLLTEPRVIDRGAVLTEEKGIMAGTPLSAFYANLYLMELDFSFIEKEIPYCRYSDDIILFANSMESCKLYAGYLRSFIEESGLTINPSKESFNAPDEGWSFLGFSYNKGIIDIAPVSVEKMKNKMRRKARALKRWKERSELSGSNAAQAFIRIFNRKLFDPSDTNDLSWDKWFFPVINTDASLRIIDSYAQDCVRFLISGKRTKSRFNVRYEDIRSLGLKNLVHEYYTSKNSAKEL